MKKRYIVIIVICILILILGIYLLTKYTQNKKEEENKLVNELYENISSSTCTTIDISEDLSDDAVMYAIFSTLENNDLLSESISLTDYQKASNIILGEDTDVFPDGFEYGGYSYTLNDEVIEGKETECGENYIYKMHAYSYDDDQIIMDVRMGYTENGSIYDLEGNLLGEDEEDLDMGTIRMFFFTDGYLTKVLGE